jgi:ELWxxDGT repeat protein
VENLESRLTPSVTLVKDIYSYTNSSLPQNLTDVNGTLFFQALDNTNTDQLYNNTPAGANNYTQLTTGSRLSSMGGFVNLGGKLFFSAFDSNLGFDALWTSDGTVAGTHPFLAGGDAVRVYTTDGSTQGMLTNSLVFEAFDSANGQFDLWISNGTSAGTHPIQAGTTTLPTGQFIDQFTNVNGTLYFQWADTTNYQLWKTGGTAATTVKVAELGTYAPTNFTAVGTKLYFEEYDPTNTAYALWSSAGTAATTTMAADITATPFYSLTGFSNKVWFQVADATDAPNTGYALWSSDGLGANTIVFKFNNGLTPVQVQQNSPMVVIGTNLYLVGWDATHLYSLWKTDGVKTNNNTATVQTTGATPFNSSPLDFGLVGTELYFAATDTGNSKIDLWKSDGTSAGTVPVQGTTDATPAQNLQFYPIVASNGKAFFTAEDIDTLGNSPHGYELWSSDGTALNTVMVADINTTTGSSNPSSLTAVGSEIFFNATDNTGSTYLYQSDGTAVNTLPVQTSLNVLPTGAQNLLAVGTNLFFTANGPDGNELWTSGTALNSASPFQHGGAQQIALNPVDLVNDNGVVYFFANDAAHSAYALWKTDGTPGNTVPVVDLPAGNSSGTAGQLTLAGTTLFYEAYDSGGLTEALWKYNGTTATFVADISTNGFSATTAVGARVFFQAYDFGASAWALWTSDGLTATQLTHFANGTNLGGQIAFNGELFYDAYDAAAGNYALWMSDGTVANTQLYLTTSGTPVLLSGNPDFTIMGTNLYFADFDLASQFLLAKTDGTAAGFATVQAGSTGTIANFPSNLVNDNGILLFQAFDSAHGYELWQSDGTAAGTVLSADILTGTGSSFPAGMTVAGSLVFFQANDNVHGYELWDTAPSSSGSGVTTGSLSGPTDGVTMQHRPFILTASDTNPANNLAGFSFAITWGDGTSQTVSGLSGITTDHQYAAVGNFTVSVVATNLADGSSSAPFTQVENITQTEVQGGNLTLGGVGATLTTTENWVITKGTKAGSYTVTVNGTAVITSFTPAVGEEFLLYAGNGTNTYTINDTGTTIDTFTLGTGFVTFIKAMLVPQNNPGPWTVNGDNAKDTYTINGAANATINGGTGVNTYNIQTGGSLSGILNGGSGATNTLSYSTYSTSGVVVDLVLGSATAIDGGVSGGITGINNVTGSLNGGDILVGNANKNILKANKGHNILIAGSNGGDTLTSGGADILIAGTTSYDSNIAALQTILAKWVTSTPATYATVISAIMANTFADPLNATTVTDSGASDTPDTLTGSNKATTDWFFAHTAADAKKDVISGQGAGDTVTSI